ncbi:unnamed protein product, partial [Vitis vinifera]
MMRRMGCIIWILISYPTSRKRTYTRTVTEYAYDME